MENKRCVVYGPAYPFHRLLICLVVELRLGPAKQMVRLCLAFIPQQTDSVFAVEEVLIPE